MYEITKPDISYIRLSDGDKGISETISSIRTLVDRYSVDWDLISLSREITRQCNERDKLGEADALFMWLKNNIKYYHDPIEAELLQNPLITIQERAGDCDDMVILLAAMNKAIGNDIAYVTISLPGENEFSHIYMIVICRITGEVKGYDPATGDFPGWVPPIFGRVRVWYDEKNYKDLAGIEEFFKKLFGWIKKNIDRVFKEIGRNLRKMGLGGVLDEIGRAFFKIQKEFNRWEDKLGIFGKFLVIGVKVLASTITGGALLVGQAYFYAMEKIIGSANPFRLNREEWKILANIALAAASIVLTIVTMGATAELLAGSVILLMQAALTAIDLRDQKKQREEVIKKLKEAEAKLSIEKRVQREAIAKLEVDISLLEKMLNRLKEKEAVLTVAKLKYQTMLDDVWANAKQAVLNYTMKKELELQEYIKEISLKYGVAI